MAIATIPGFPRIGKRREMKHALEGYWSGKISAAQLLETAHAVRLANWQTEWTAGLDLIPVNDFTLYDQVLDTAAMVGAVPPRYGWQGETVDLDTYFAMARGRVGAQGVSALEMTKWFDTNYHYLVPDLTQDQTFRLSSGKPLAEFIEAKAVGVNPKPVLVGPITFLLLAKSPDASAVSLSLLEKLLPIYTDVVARLAAEGAEWIQLDEPALVMDRTPEELAAVEHAYSALAAAKGNAKLLVQTAYGHVGDAYQTLIGLPIDGIGLDFVRGLENYDLIEQHGFPQDKWLAAGVVDGRNVWVTDLAAALADLQRLLTHVSVDRLMVSASCSLLHVPYDVRLETELDPEIRSWLAFAEQKLHEIATLTKAVNDGADAVAQELAANREVVAARRASARHRNNAVRERLANLPAHTGRAHPYPVRAEKQQERLGLPLLPTTTIGSFPQTPEVRSMRRRFERGDIDQNAYDEFLSDQIRQTIEFQEEVGLDVLVHGEAERNDMVQYFGEQLDGFVFTHHGWVQSYGSRYVRPPIIFGDISRPAPMTVRWSTYAQSLSKHPVKGMLTGPVTILNWSFVRDDQPRSETCRQIALAIRDEVTDLDEAGLATIQIDEPALREGLPLRHADWQAYLDWAVGSFRLATGSARDETQIHTHMCYSEFNEIIDAIAALDADVISIENARSDNELLTVFQDHGYDKGIGPGVYDIHSPRVPGVEEIVDNLKATIEVLKPGQVWVNPDCGLKTRRWEEVRPSLEHLVAAADEMRKALAK